MLASATASLLRRSHHGRLAKCVLSTTGMPSVPSRPLSAAPKTDEEIADAAVMEPIDAVADRFGVPASALELYGKYKAKVSHEFSKSLVGGSGAGAGGAGGEGEGDKAKVVLVTATSPTRFGEGKTCTSVGLSDALNRVGTRSVVCLREPSLGPVFGVKGGAAGGGHAQVVPMRDINLHFTGDLHAIGAAHNLLSVSVDAAGLHPF